MRFFKKNIYWLVLTVILCAIMLYALSSEEKPEVFFLVDNGHGTEEIFVYKSEEGTNHVFLPSYSDMDHVKVGISSDTVAVLNSVRLTDGMVCTGFELEKQYEFSIDVSKPEILQFHKSANVATMHIDTASGGLRYLDANKNHEEHATVAVYTSDGELNHFDASGRIKGRGNSTWIYDKKPYLLTLSSNVDLLGMGEATEWVLLANAVDETNLRNKLVLDLAEKTGLEWTPDSYYVDVYFNGRYHGLYLLTEKVEVAANRVDFDLNSGDFLCKIDMHNRWERLRNPFETQSGRAVEISFPEALADTDMARIERLVNQMEQTIRSGENLNEADGFDLDSWVRRYLIDEISGNVDADKVSSYFFFSDGEFYAGPVWDYDLAFKSSSGVFIAKQNSKTARAQVSYNNALYQNESFYAYMTQVYQHEFLPVLQQMASHDITDLADKINAASNMNSVRWSAMFAPNRTEENHSERAATLIQYVNGRIEFLSSAWLDNQEYCSVQFEPAQGAWITVSVKMGELLNAEIEGVAEKDWIVKHTLEEFDITQPITEDLVLINETVEQGSSVENATRDIITVFSVAAMICLLLAFLIKDIKLRIEERRGTNGRL